MPAPDLLRHNHGRFMMQGGGQEAPPAAQVRQANGITEQLGLRGRVGRH